MFTRAIVIEVFLWSLTLIFVPSCGVEQMILAQSGTADGTPTQAETAAGLREALMNGIGEASVLLSQPDGYLGNPAIRIPFPPEAEKVASTLRKAGLGKMVDDVELSINRAAEDAAASAKPIFLEAIKSLTIRDAMGILFGGEQAATNHLRQTTSAQLTAAFKPIISASLDKVNATRYWSDAITAYNKIPLVQKQNPDLVDYVNTKALEGLFFTVAAEEKKIRENPVLRTSDLLKKVFTYYDRNK